MIEREWGRAALVLVGRELGAVAAVAAGEKATGEWLGPFRSEEWRV